MKEKIDWYKEVLELEPNSRVFLSLAKLLVQDGQSGEAIQVLENGLERHPEFLEARLLLIEILYRERKTDLCSTQIKKLSAIFASYAGFWQAWAACLSEEPEDADTASILHFIAARFITGPLQLHDVINRGINSILAENGGAPKAWSPVDKPATDNPAEELPVADEITVKAEEALPPLPGDIAENSEADSQTETAIPEAPDTMEIMADTAEGRENASAEERMDAEASLDESLEPMEAPITQAEDMEQEFALEAEDAPTSSNELEVQVVPESAAALANATQKKVKSAHGMVSLEELSVAEKIDELELPMQPEQPLSVNIEDESMPAESSMEAAHVELAASETPASRSAALKEQEEESEEPFSLRTRSMAEVHAEQGNVKEALDIYYELAASTQTPDEAAEIKQRIAALEAQLPAADANETADHGARSRENLIGMLEALASRVEARASN